MARPVRDEPLRVLQNAGTVGWLSRDGSGVLDFRYDAAWLTGEFPVPVSLSMPLREDPFRGAAVSAFFENLLPDSEALRQRIATKVGARGTDAFSLLSEIGRDCVGALQFLRPDDDVSGKAARIEGETLRDKDIAAMLSSLRESPLGLDRDRDFRISVAGAQEKTALLFHNGKWMKPKGTTPTTHLFKTQIGSLPNGLDLSNSVENEFYCLRLLEAFGLPVNQAKIESFDGVKVLVVERFDRHRFSRTEIVRLPAEDCCQALSIPPSRKYQADGGPGMNEILNLLKASDTPEEDQGTFLKAQILFWLIGATDGHAKNFSIFLGPQGRCRMTPIYDVLSAQPSADALHIHRKHIKLAMFVGRSRHYVMDGIRGRHFVQTAERAGIAPSIAKDALREIADRSRAALAEAEASLPSDFPAEIHGAISRGMIERLPRLAID